MHAARNISLCNKDCICLFVCPTGATDTETGQIDFENCIEGCRLCVDACPSHAIYLVPSTYAAPQQEKSELVKNKMFTLIASKSVQENLAASIAGDTDNPVVRQLAKALEKSNRIMAEECFREAGFMLPQSQETKELLRGLLDGPQIEDYPKEIIERLLELL
jgi:Fe-S-cluster-containing hydrogenase component 2